MLSRTSVLALICLSTAWLLDPAPARADRLSEEELRRLVRQLDSPRSQQREAATRRLNRVGDEALPLLLEIQDDLSFEVRLRIDPIINMLENSRRAVVISGVLGRTSWFNPAITPGEIIYRVNDAYVDGVEDFYRALEREKQEGVVLHVRGDRGPRIVNLAEQAPRFTVDAYEAAYGSFLIEGIEAAVRHRYGEAIAAFDAARAAGFDMERARFARVWYLVCQYYVGQREEAYRTAEEVAGSLEAGGRSTPWHGIAHAHAWYTDTGRRRNRIPPFHLTGSDRYAVHDDHLGLYFRRQAVRHHPAEMARNDELAEYLTLLHRLPESIAAWVPHLAHAAAGEHDPRSHALGNLLESFEILGMDEEALAVCRLLAEGEVSIATDSMAVDIAQRLGDTELALELMKAHLGEAPDALTFGLDLRAIGHLLIVTGRTDALADSFRRWDPDILLSNAAPRFGLYSGWHALAEVWGRAAARVVKENPRRVAEMDALGRVQLIEILQRQSSPDIHAIDLAIEASIENLRRDSPDWDPSTFLAYHDAIKATFRGDFAPMVAHLESRFDARRLDHHPGYRAALFLREHGDALTDDDDGKWLRTWHACAWEDGSLLLLTRDLHVGRADRGSPPVTTLPLPHPAWSSCGPNRRWGPGSDRGPPIIASASRRTLGSVHNGRFVYALRPSDATWRLVLEMPSDEIQADWYDDLEPLLDALCDHALANGPIRVLRRSPSKDELFNKNGVGTMILRDGTRLTIHRDGTLVNVTARLAEHLGEPVTIHNTFAAFGGTTWYFTTRGILTESAEGAILRLEPPGLDPAAPVTYLWDRDARRYAFGVLPHAGGDVFHFDPDSGAMTRENRVNESYPVTYWLARPPEENRAAVIKAVRAAGHEWPIDLRPGHRQE